VSGVEREFSGLLSTVITLRCSTALPERGSDIALRTCAGGENSLSCNGNYRDAGGR